MTKIIALCNHKGGVGKTTTAVNLAAALTLSGKKVSLIDIDPQGHSTLHLGIKPNSLNMSTYNVLSGDCSFKDILIEKENIHLIPSNIHLSGAQKGLGSIAGSEYLLKESLEENNFYKDYDYIFIDCPPNLEFLTINALTAASEVYIIVQLEFLSIEGLKNVLEAIKTVKKRLNNNLEITGILGTFLDKRKTLNRDIFENLNNELGNIIFDTAIRDNISLAESPSKGLSIFKYKKDSYGAIDYLNLSKEILSKEKTNE